MYLAPFAREQAYEVNNGRKSAILNLIKSKFVRVHPPLKPYILFLPLGPLGPKGYCRPPHTLFLLYTNMVQQIKFIQTFNPSRHFFSPKVKVKD